MDAFDSIDDMLTRCDYEPIDAYGVVGDFRTAALVSRSGSIDWLCLPHFSAPSIFAALLDRRRGGRFVIRPREIRRIERRYIGRSAVLETTFHCASGTMTLTDFMAIPGAATVPHRLFRLIYCETGAVACDVAYQPRPDYARRAVNIERSSECGWLYRQADAAVLLHTDAPLTKSGRSDLVGGTLQLCAGQHYRFVLACGQSSDEPVAELEGGREHLNETLDWWEKWCGHCTYEGFHAEMVMRSCITLKLLTHHRSGAVMAAITTSLPESLDAGRNWDYRYCWLRDTSLLLESFMDIGFQRESQAFLVWLLRVGRDPRLQPFYDLNAKPVPKEVILSHLEGYRGCAPVRIGNEAREQLQLDIYGEVMQTACNYVARGGHLSEPKKQLLASLGEAVCKLWREPDKSIWEPRNAPRHYTYSKMMCWVALDRLIHLQRRVPLGMSVKALRHERDRIREDIDSHGFNPELGSYVGYYGGTDPDASLLLMIRYGYGDARDPRVRGTYRYIMEKLSDDGLLYRYPPGKAYDGIDGPENHFVVCSFWAVDHLARSGKLDAAVDLFEHMLKYANDLGLYAEQIKGGAEVARGNLPQAFSHSGLITAAMAIDQGLRGKSGSRIPS